MSSRDAMFPSAESCTHESTEVQYYGTVRGMGRRALLPPFRAIRVVKKRLFGFRKKKMDVMSVISSTLRSVI
jgi:hypothetical protein